jgi:UDP-2,3-diacylglucosamine pyrophosphatase LpxH
MTHLTVLTAVAISLSLFAPAGAQPTENEPALIADDFAPPPDGPRYRVFISDLHLGVGRKSDGRWHPTEDFRWPKALAAFLNEISRRGADRTDLIIVGDFLEMWQPPPHIRCAGVSADLGCTLDEMGQLTALIAEQHQIPLASLRAFAERGDNRLHIIPGNHDSSLRYQKVWSPIGEKLNASAGRVNFVRGGLWSSPDGAILAEHGHQIGLDVNRYETWPRVVKTVNSTDYVIRPWGELFVQKLFNDQEETYEIIDNLSPESAGARYRAADRGLWGSTSDIARLLMFNLLETSPKQKAISLGGNATGKREWNIERARKLGANLFIKAVSPDDPLRIEIERGGPAAEEIKASLAAIAADEKRLPNEEVFHLCDLIADRGEANLCLASEQGALAQYLLVAKEKVMARHLSQRLQQAKRMRLFIYGHTHQYELPWQVQVGIPKITVANTGAFQRLVSEAGFLKRLNGMSPQEGLRKISLDQLAPCYSAILVKPPARGYPPKAEVIAWYMEEDKIGEFISLQDSRCQ